MNARIESKLGWLLAAGLLALLAGCSAADTGAGSCTSTDECAAGLACSPDGSCEPVSCDQCIDGESCMRMNEDGEYDASEEGVCSSTECSSGGRGGSACPEGEVCIDGICYEGESDPEPGICTCREDCAAGQVCFGGTCSAPLAACTSDCECPVGTACVTGACEAVADPCAGVTCDPGLTCNPTTGLCEGGTSACDPPCAAGETCNEATGVCEGGGAGGLCTACSTDDECGGDNDLCVNLGGETVCGTECATGDDCPSGYSCFQAVAGLPMQCVSTLGSCEGCLGTGCATGQFCNPETTVCEPVVDSCGACSVSFQCGEDGSCVDLAGGRFCLDRCSGDADCAADGGTCQSVGGDMVCVPAEGGCGGVACELSPTDCTGDTPILDSVACDCVGCVNDSDCGTDGLCTDDGTCVAGGTPCERITDCPSDQICDTRVGVCVDCITPGDCPAGEICNRGICEPCDCPAGFSCDVTGECIEVGDPSDCSSDSECQRIAEELGYTGSDAACDSTIGCYIVGVCNGSLGGGGLPIPGLDFGGETDPFNAPCAPGSTCSMNFEITDIFGGEPEFFTFACMGCDETDPSTCREGETCSAPLLDLLETGPSCGGGGGGSPFPFP